MYRIYNFIGFHKPNLYIRITWYLAPSLVCAFFFPALGMGLCVAFIALVRLPSLKVSTLLLVGLLLYDVFWVSPQVCDIVDYVIFSNPENCFLVISIM